MTINNQILNWFKNNPKEWREEMEKDFKIQKTS